MPKRIVAAFCIALATALLSGCAQGTFTSSSFTYSSLEADADSGDTLPREVVDAASNLAPDTARFVGEHNETSLWLAWGVEGDSVCLVQYPNDGEWSASCNNAGGTMEVLSVDRERIVVVPDGAPVPDDAVVLTPNVYVLA